MNSNDIHEEPLKRGSSFGERLVENDYFAGAGHLTILVNMRRDIAARVPMLILTGEEGCGKTVFGRMVAAESRPGCIAVYFNRTVDSFEDLVCTVAERLNIEVPEETRDGIAAAVEQIAVAVSVRNERLLLICDGAERIYLATLERLRKMMDRLNRVVVSMQMVLIGRPLLLDNLRQLSICNFEEIEEKRYVLEPLTQAETRSYLEFCKKKMPDTESGIFTQETIDRMYQGSLGNFKQIHNLAEQLCTRYNKDASFWVLLENVAGGPEKKVLRRSSHRRALPPLEKFDPRKLSRRHQLIGGGAVAVLIVLFLLLNSGSKEPVDPVPVVLDNAPEAAQIQEEAGEESLVTQEEPPSDQAVQTAESDQSTAEAPPDTAEVPVPEQTEPGAGENIDDPESPRATEREGTEAAVVVEETEPVDTPAQRELLQADNLVAEARQAVEIARSAKGPEMEAALKVAGPEMDAALTESPEVPVLTAVPEKTEIVVLPAKVVEKTGNAAEKFVASVPVLKPERAKKHVAETGSVAEENGSEVEMAVRQPPEAGTSKATVSLIAAGNSKQKKMAVDSGITNANAVSVPTTANTSQVETPPNTVVESAQALQAMAPSSADKRPPGDAKTKKIPVLSKAIVPEKKLMTAGAAYPARVAAGVPWLDGKKNDKYTMQLMVLRSGSARKNAQEILTQREYARQAGNLYIFEKRSGTPAVFVFMGEFNTLAEAQAARSSISPELQKNEPYILSVPEAMQKVK